MIREECETAYPQTVNAITFHEDFMSETVWELVRKNGLSVDKVQTKLIDSANTVIRLCPLGPLTDCLEEMSTVDFTRYLRAKLDMM